MRRLVPLLVLLPLLACAARSDRQALVMIIESSPSNLDPRIGTDAASERIGSLIFDSLVQRDEHFNLQPALAERWDILDPRTYIFHLRRGVRFHDGRPLTSRDVKWTFDSLLKGTVVSARAGAYRLVESIDAPDDATVIFHLKEPFAPLLWNVSNGAMGIVPYGSGKDFNQSLIGSGPFKFAHAELDKEVVLVRNEEYWGEKPKLARIRFAVVPDTTTRALELDKGSADIAINSLPADMVATMAKQKRLIVEKRSGTTLAYLAFNLRDPVLRDVRVRRALAYAIDRRPMIEYLWRGLARPADSILPPQHWAYDGDVQRYEYEPAKARALLDAAGYRVTNGVRFHLTMKTSTEESTRLMAAVLQQQLRAVGVALDIRTFEFATFYSDVQKGSFQLFSLRWIGGNEDPDIFEYVFHSTSTPPKRANRGYYSNPRVDALVDAGRRELDREKRKAIYFELQKILADDLPYINLWYLDNVAVHSSRIINIQVNPSGNYEFLRRAELR
ncbi:MAG: ABC transporter substrate-binding protein [Candidatus Koribacter versatilis]|uniref:ABC transporter substrate-binding protein n=1 Tax=Candidatus Korobacter versatilis TaxID=658062 RepID=A0A932A6A0_9BACT|nr:ABC transporter substrate-binding protein [Candidatus Koribacter versatilis]